MRTFFAFVAVALLSSSALAQNIPITATDSGISATAIATVATSNPIDMEPQGKRLNQLSLTIAVTPGTTATIEVRCYESSAKTSGYAIIAKCNSAGACIPWVRTFTLTDYATVSGKKYIKTRWSIREQFAECSVLDPLGGSGTATMTGTRSWQ